MHRAPVTCFLASGKDFQKLRFLFLWSRKPQRAAHWASLTGLCPLAALGHCALPENGASGKSTSRLHGARMTSSRKFPTALSGHFLMERGWGPSDLCDPGWSLWDRLHSGGAGGTGLPPWAYVTHLCTSSIILTIFPAKVDLCLNLFQHYFCIVLLSREYPVLDFPPN